MEQPIDERKERRRLQSCLLSTLVPAGILAGKKTIEECMQDEVLRTFGGHALLKEIMPCMGLPKITVEKLAVDTCRELEHPALSLALPRLLEYGVRGWIQQALPFVEAFLDREEALPSCLTMGLAALIMVLAGVRQEESGAFSILRENEAPWTVQEDEEILYAFSRLSCDMPPEMLAYAALSDRVIWEKDLRELPGLEEKVAEHLQNLQVLGVMGALQRAWETAPENGLFPPTVL